MKRKVSIIILAAFMIVSFHNGIYSYDSKNKSPKIEEQKTLDKKELAEKEELRLA